MGADLWDNPVIVKEFRGRMRGPRAYWLLFGYLALLSLTMFFAYLSWWNQHSASMQFNSSAAGFTVGRTFFLTIFYAQAVLISLITPALTSGAISLEREQRTFEMLRATTLSPRAIALGKLASSVSFVVLLLTSSLPLVSLCFLLGGVSPGEVFFGYLLLVADAFLFGAVGLAWSTHAGSTAAATGLTYGSVLLWFFLTLPTSLNALSGFSNPNFSMPLAAVNPLGAVAAAVQPERYYRMTLAGWIPALLLIAALGAVWVLACINRLEDDPARRAWPLRVATLVFCVLLLLFADGAALGTPLFLLGGFPFGTAGMQILMMVSLGVVLVFVPPFVTGEPVAGPPYRLWRGALPSGLPFALVLTALIVAMMFLSMTWSLLSPNNIGRSAGASALSGTMDFLLVQASVLLFMVTLGIGGVGLLLSVLLKSRWAALIALYGLVALALIVPPASYAALDSQQARAAWGDPAINSLYLCPGMAVTQIVEDAATNSPTFAVRYPVVQGLAGSAAVPFWVVTAAIYGLIGVICYGVGIRRLQRLSSPASVRTT